MSGIAAIIEARMDSSRLPGKVLLEVMGKPLLGLLIERIQKVSKINKIIVATTVNPKDQIIEEYCQENKILCFRGSEEDVMGRVLGAAINNDVGTIVQITGDCPLIDPQIISQILNCYLNNDYDYVGNSHIRSYPDGMDVQVFSKNILENSYNITRDKLDREHVSLHIRRTSTYSKFNIVAPSNLYYPKLGLTLDDHKDYLLIKEIFESFQTNNFSLIEILDLLNNKKPELKSLNKDVKRKGDN
jgi:spore coat polysaccharide biosynthesis protein SpsF